MPRGYAGAPDPDKGIPYRHVRQKIRLLLSGRLALDADGEVLLAVLLKVAEKRPDDVLDAVISVLGDETEANDDTRPKSPAPSVKSLTRPGESV
ncbi:MAG TPA: hypothetical protein VGG75_38085 [Trebonia sp.]|jgi:hypothetical protein